MAKKKFKCSKKLLHEKYLLSLMSLHFPFLSVIVVMQVFSSGAVRLMGIFIFIFIGTPCCTLQQFPAMCEKVCLPTSQPDSVSLLISTILSGKKLEVTLALIGLSFILRKTEHLFIYLKLSVFLFSSEVYSYRISIFIYNLIRNEVNKEQAKRRTWQF